MSPCHILLPGPVVLHSSLRAPRLKCEMWATGSGREGNDQNGLLVHSVNGLFSAPVDPDSFLWTMWSMPMLHERVGGHQKGRLRGQRAGSGQFGLGQVA